MTVDRLEHLPILFKRLNLKSLSDSDRQKIALIDSCLPQTQCGLCDHPDGCLPYATAIVVNNEAHNKCVPGGQPVSDAIAALMHRPALAARPSQWSVNPATNRPNEVRAVIREEDCIGCTKCIPACPVDAIIGTGKHMHTIFTDLCTGCELCLPPCPVDCIDLIEIPSANVSLSSEDNDNFDEQLAINRAKEQKHLRQRYHNHLNRFVKQLSDNTVAKPVTNMVETKLGNATKSSVAIDEHTAKITIAAAKLRTKIKKLEKQLSVRPNAKKDAELIELKNELEHLINATE